MTTSTSSLYGPMGKVAAPRTIQAPKCYSCQRRLGEFLTIPFSLRCHRCGEQNRST